MTIQKFYRTFSQRSTYLNFFQKKFFKIHNIMTKTYTFISPNNKIFSIALSWNDLNKFYPPIRDDLFTTDKYFIQSKLKNDVFQYFLDYFLDKSEVPIINSENIYDYYILSIEFHFELFSNLLSQSEFKIYESI